MSSAQAVPMDQSKSRSSNSRAVRAAYKKYTINRVERPLGMGRAFKFFNTDRISYVFGGSNNFSDTTSSWTDGTVNMDPEFNCCISPVYYDGCSFLSLLFDNNPTTSTATKISAAKHPDMWKYLTAIPVYYGVRMTIERAYIQLDTNTDASYSMTASDVQFAQNLAAGQTVEFYYYWDSQNYNKLINFANANTAGFTAFRYFLENRKFKSAIHRPGDQYKCSINGKMSLPHVTQSVGSLRPYPYPSGGSDEATAVTLRNFFANTVSAQVASLSPPGSLYFSPVMPFVSEQFKTLFNTADSETKMKARLVIDVKYTTKLIIRCSNGIGYMLPWTDSTGAKPIPSDIPITPTP